MYECVTRDLHCIVHLYRVYRSYFYFIVKGKIRRSEVLQLQQTLKPLNHFCVHLNGLNLVLISPNIARSLV